MTKICLKCKLPTEDFGIDKSKKDGLSIYCKPCLSNIRNSWYENHKKEELDRAKSYRDSHKNDADYLSKKVKHNKKYRTEHADEIRERKLKNRDVLLQRKRELRRLRLENDPVSVMLESSKCRAKKKNLEHSITKNDIYIPDVCPVLGILLKIGKGLPTDNSPSLDRIDNSRGYVKGNVIVISHRANTLKRNSTIEELEKIVDFYKKL
jgi:hypothetical protein